MQKVGLPEPHSAVNEEGIVFSARIFRDGLCRGESIFVGFALDEGVKGVFFQKRIVFFGSFDVLLVNDETSVGKGDALFFEIFPLLLFDDDLHVRDKRIEGIDHLFYLVQITSFYGFFGDSGLCGKHKNIVHETDGFERLDPHIVAYRLHGFREFVFYIIPKFFFSDHR